MQFTNEAQRHICFQVFLRFPNTPEQSQGLLLVIFLKRRYNRTQNDSLVLLRRGRMKQELSHTITIVTIIQSIQKPYQIPNGTKGQP